MFRYSRRFGKTKKKFKEIHIVLTMGQVEL